MEGLDLLRLGYPVSALNGRVFHSVRQLKGNRSLKKRVGVNLKAVAEVLDAHGLNPTEEVIKLIQQDRIDDDLKARIYMELTEYIAPKLARTEHVGKDGGDIKAVVTWRSEST